MKKDLVVDPRETWTDVFKRIRDFDDPKMIPREELPEEHQPHSSFYNKMVNWSNGIDPKRPNQQKVKPDDHLTDLEGSTQTIIKDQTPQHQPAASEIPLTQLEIPEPKDDDVIEESKRT